MIRFLVALIVLVAGAWALPSAPAAQEPLVEAGAPVPPAVETPAPGSAALPSEPMELAAYALAHAREPGQCRFAYLRLSTTVAQVGWSDADAEIVAHFDPRLPIGERWSVVRASRQQRAIQRALTREDRQGLPSDLIALTAEGEWTMENLAFASEQPDRLVFSYTPRARRERVLNETGIGIIEQLVGQLEVSRETGQVIGNTLREPPEEAVRALGIVRVRRALIRSDLAPVDNLQLVTSGSQMFSMSALLTQTEVTTSYRYADVEAICDPAEVARIGEAEAAVAASRRD